MFEIMDTQTQEAVIKVIGIGGAEGEGAACMESKHNPRIRFNRLRGLFQSI